jgi:FkbM family methyltransferase
VNLVTYAFPSVGMPTGVIHVGGFDGNEEQWYRQWNAKSVWFEPLPAKCREMQAKGLDARQFAIGSAAGTARLHLSKSLQCCSLLEPSGHLEQYPEFPFSGDIDVEVRTLDSFALTGFDMLVIDAQGYELEVLKGAEQTLRGVKIIYCEVAIIDLYQGGALFHEIHAHLSREWQFVGMDFVDGIVKGWGDALFVRK